MNVCKKHAEMNQTDTGDTSEGDMSRLFLDTRARAIMNNWLGDIFCGKWIKSTVLIRMSQNQSIH